MGPGDIKQKIDERGARSNLGAPRRLFPPFGEGLGTAGRGAPRQTLPPAFGPPVRGAGGRDPAPGRPGRPADSRRVSRPGPSRSQGSEAPRPPLCSQLRPLPPRRGALLPAGASAGRRAGGAGLPASVRSLPPAARLPRGAPGASWHQPRRAASLKAPPAPRPLCAPRGRSCRGAQGQRHCSRAERPAIPPPWGQNSSATPSALPSCSFRSLRRPGLDKMLCRPGYRSQGPGFQQVG